MIRKCNPNDFELIHDIINDAAKAYQGHIPADQWREPYMSKEELADEMGDGVSFWGYEAEEGLVGVMGIQPKMDVTLIRHAYVRSVKRNQGIGGHLLTYLCALTAGPILIGTWVGAHWAIQFYEKHGFRLVAESEKEHLLSMYWKVSARQMETSVVLADPRWYQSHVDINTISGGKHG